MTSVIPADWAPALWRSILSDDSITLNALITKWGDKAILNATCDEDDGAAAGVARRWRGHKCTALHIAAGLGKRQTTLALLENPNTNVNAEMDSGATPLLIALQRENVGIASALLRRPDIDAGRGDSKGRNALYYAVRAGHEEIVDVLLSKGLTASPPPNSNDGPRSWLLLALSHGRADVALTILQSIPIGTPPGSGGVNAVAPISGQSALHIALERPCHSVALALLKRADIDVNVVTPSTGTPLMAALGAGFWRALLLHANTGDSTMAKSDAEMVRMLLRRAGVVLCSVDASGWSALAMASRWQSAPFVAAFVRNVVKSRRRFRSAREWRRVWRKPFRFCY